MVDLIATLLSLILFALPVVAVAFLIIKIVKKSNKKKEADIPKQRKEKFVYWVIDCKCTEDYIKYYRHELIENDDYNLTAKELKEDFCDEKVYKYDPLKLPLKMDGLNVYSYREKDEWEKIGRLKKTSDLDGDLELYLYPNIYKYVSEEGITKETDDSYFGVTLTKTIKL